MFKQYADATGTIVPPPPPVGDLDINSVKNSKFFFA
jgi:DNA-directed RNA polymerase